MAKKTNDKMVKEGGDGLTKDQRRNRNLKLKAEAKQRAFNEKLPWFDDIPAAAFHQNFDEAFKNATEHPKATEILTDPAAPVTTTTPVTEETKPTVAEKADAAVARFEERNKTAELAAAAKAAMLGTTANDNAEQTDGAANDDPVQEQTEQGAPVAEQTLAEGEPAPSDTVEKQDAEATGTEEPRINEFDDNGKLIRWPGESSKLYGRRAHKAKLEKAWKDKPPETTVVEETRNGEPPQETVTTEAPVEIETPTGKQVYNSDVQGQSAKLPGLPQGKTPSEINKALPLDLPEAKVDPMLKLPNESKKAWKARIALLNQVKVEIDQPQETVVPEKSAKDSANAFEAAAMNDNETVAEAPDATKGDEAATTTETPVADTPAEEAPQEQPAEVQEPVQTEPVSKPEAQGPVEAKTTKKPTLTLASTNPKPTRPAGTVEAAKKFYGNAWNDKRAADLTDAYHWLSCAIEEQAKGSDLLSGKGKLYMIQALKREANAFATTTAMAA